MQIELLIKERGPEKCQILHRAAQRDEAMECHEAIWHIKEAVDSLSTMPKRLT